MAMLVYRSVRSHSPLQIPRFPFPRSHAILGFRAASGDASGEIPTEPMGRHGSSSVAKAQMGCETSPYGCFLKWWYPTTMGFPTKNDHFGVF